MGIGIEKLVDKLKKIKKGMIEDANGGIQAIKGSPDSQGIKEVGKEVLKEATGLKARLIQEGSKFIKTYMKDTVTQENPTGATLGALGEYIVKKTASGFKAVTEAVTSYVEKEAGKYHTIDTIPELGVVKELINQYAGDQQETGSETLNYKGVEILANKTEKNLSITLRRSQTTVSLTYLLKDRKITDLNEDFEMLTEDLVNRLDRLSDPTISTIDKTTILKLPYKKGGEQTKYTTDTNVHMKKENGTYEVTYTPENKNSGVILKYVLQKPAMEEPTDKSIPEMLKEE